MGVLWLLLTAFAILTSESEGQTDPCSSTVYSDISDLAKRDPSYAMDSVALCDRYISAGWYRGGYHRMPTSPPNLSFCGTLYPVWLNGQHPPENTISSVEVCKVGFSDPCSQRFNINVKNCSTYAVYQLQALDSCNSAYCFEPSTDCVAGVPTNLGVSYHSVSWKTEVNGIIKRHDPSVNLKCSFTPLSDNSLFYDISWYVDNVEVVSGQTVDSASLDDALLSAIDMLSKNKKAGSMIHCVVGAKRTTGGIACDKTSSPLFFAGIKVLTQQLTLDRGGTGTVRLQFTIPYTTENIVINSNAVDVSDLNVNLAVFNESSISCKDGNSKLCGIKVKGYSYSDRNKYSTDDWKQIYTLNVFNRDNGDYTDFDRHITLRLETGGTNGDGSKIFESISLPDIQVYINEPTSAWKGRTCAANTDPHMYTFDGYAYECQLDGRFILYRNELFNQEVQVKHHLCYPSYPDPRCTCAVAVRSGRDIFTVDICSGNTFINFPLCEDKVLKVIRKNDKRYQVLLPTGTMVQISLRTWPISTRWQIDVVIYPSASDVGKTSGLCGVLDGGINNDLTRRDNTIDNPNDFSYYGAHPNDFSISWRIPDNEDLFTDSQTVYANLNSISTTLTRVCTCKETSARTGEIECNYGTFKDCKFKVGKQFHCILNPEGSRRRKRDLTHLKSLTENLPEMEPNEEIRLARYKRQAVDVTTLEVAYNVCTKAFDESEAFTTCQQYVTDLSNTTIDNCISDVVMTGDYNITKIHIEAALEQCSTLVLYNTSFQVEQPEITYQVESLCPNNCSGNGVCSQGNCTCNPNFAGSDCGFDLLGPPTISHISDFGLCDKSNEECDEITLYGQLFLENMNTECYFTRRTLQEDGTIVSQAYLKTSLEPRTLFEGYCSLSYSAEPSWVSEFTFNVTNDGTRFTDSYDVHVYQSLCQEYQNTSGNVSFSLKNGYCFIDGKCYANGNTNPGNLCDLCNATYDKYNWTFNEGHCFIDNTCYVSGAINGTNACSTCLPSIDPGNWSDNPGYCYIDNICYFDGQSKADNDCFVCNYTQNRNGWIFNEGHCLIDGGCFKAGENKTSESCKVCNPLQDKNNWTLSPGFCSINNSCLTDGESGPSNLCLMCNASINQYSLSPHPGYCDIGDLCIPDGQSIGSKPCLYCNTSLTRNSWSFNQGYCFIDGICVEHGSNDTTKECKICNTSVNSSIWQIKDGYCYVQDNCYKDSDMNSTYPCQICNSSKSVLSWSSNSEYCNIDGLCVPNGQKNSTSDCLYCNTSLSEMSWSASPDYCVIDGICMEHGSNQTNKECQICDAYSNTSSWQLKDGYCFIQDQCVKDNELNATFPCLVCNATNKRDAWSDNSEYCNIDGLCLPNGQENGSSVCHYCNTSLNKEAWSSRPGYCLIDGICVEHGKNKTNMECHICDVNFNTSSWKLKDEYCNIDGFCVPNGQKNATSACFYCNTSLSGVAWSFTPGYCVIDGICMEHDTNQTNKECQICDAYSNTSSWQLKGGYCFIKDQCVKDNELNATFPCLMCNASSKQDAWSDNLGYCLIDGICVEHGKNKTNMECHICDANFNTSSWKLKDEYCNIDGICVSNGQTNGTHPCFYCNTSISREMWSFSPDYCLINGVCVEHGRNNTNMECQICDVYANVSSWQLKDGHCLIQDSCYKMDEEHGMHPCHICNVTHNPYSWSANPAYCSIDGQCISHGQRNNSNACSYCNVSLSTGTWSSTPGYCLIDGICVQHGNNQTNKECQICDAYTNTSSWLLKDGHCLIQDSCYKMDEEHEMHPCHICNVTHNPYSWSANPDYCNIDGQCISHGHRNNSNACSYCNVSLSTDTWSSTPGYCLIDGICVEHGNNNTNKECQICNAYTNSSSWQLKDGYCFIQEQCIKDNEENSTYSCQICNATRSQYSWSSNPDYCDIDGQCISHGQKNNTHACSYCNVSLSRNKWSFSTGYCLIDGICVEHGNNKTNKECQICNAYTNTSIWQLKDGYCFIQDMCIKENEANTTYPCHICNATSNPYSWSFNPEYCNIDGQCVSNGQANGTNACFYCNASLSKAAWSFSPGYCLIAGMCVEHGRNKTNSECQICDANVNTSSWQLNDGYCLIQDQCFKDTEKNLSNPCEICNVTSGKYVWSSNIDCLTTTLESTTDSSTSNILDPSTSTTSETSTSAEALTTTTITDTTTTMESSTEALMITTAAVDTTTVDITTYTTMEPSTETSTTTEMDTTITSTTLGSSTEALATTTAVETTTISTTMEPSTEPPTTTEMDTTTTSTTMGSSTEALTTTTAVETTTISTTMEPSSTIGTTATMDTTTTSAKPEPSTTTTDSSTTSKTDSTTTPTTTAPYTSTTSTTAETTSLSTCIGNANITNVSVSYQNISWSTHTDIYGEINTTIHTPSINMKCSFASTSEAGLYYQIVWYTYTENRKRIHNETVRSSSGDPSVVSLMSVNKTLGYEIQCTVGLIRNPGDEPCTIVESERFYVGLKVLDNHVTISRKGKSSVRFHLTAPYVTPTEIVDGKEQPLSSLKVQATVISQSTDSCAGQVVVNGCPMIINAHSYENRSNYVNENWKEVYHFTIYHLDTDAYIIDTSALISLTTTDNRNGIFNALHENISVLIEDRQDIWKGKSCGSKTDPHLYTFDGRSYENHLNGTFVLYQNTLYNQKIQTKHHQCHPDYDFPKCICAVSLQSGRDVFIIDICDNNQLLDFAACADGTLSFYRESDKVYKIIFPTGTSAIISLVEWPSGTNSWQVDVDVYPSLLDVNNTAGLCGTLDENQDNEFRHRNGALENYSEYPDTFSTSWIVPDDENLLNSGARQSLTSISGFLDHICTCRNGESLCAYDTYRQCTQTKRRRCSETANVLSRKKRSLDLKRDTFTSYDRVKRQTPSNVKSTSEAETICTAQFEQSEPYKTCRQHVGDLSNSSLSNCIKDIMMTGDENITSIHIEAALQQCVKFVLFNTTLQNAEPSVTYELTTLCPNNCSNKGICNEGNCTCLDGYGGSDCSFDISEPPTILRLSVNETCDKSTQDCSQIIIDGAYFLENVNNVCFYTRQLILHDRTEGVSLTSEYPVEALSLFQGACPLVYDTDETWVTKFTMNVSNDRVRFSKSFYLYTYQSECQQINRGSNDVYFTLKDNFCFVNKTCLPQHTRDSYNSCSVCDPQRAKFSWSLHQDCVSATTSAPITTTESFTSHPIFLATISVAAAVCFLTVIIVGICCYRMKSDKEDLSDSESSDSVNSGYRSPWINSYGKPIAKVFIPRARLFSNRSVGSSGYYPDWKQ